MEEKNQFEELDNEEFSSKDEEAVPPVEGNNMIAEGGAGKVYDYNHAPDYVKAPPRENLDGKEVVIEKAEIILPDENSPWQPTRKGDKFVKFCPFKLFYSEGGQQEYYSGVRVFKSDGGKYSHPSITKDGSNQASGLMVKYAEFKGKDVNEVSLKEFLAFLNSKPKCVIAGTEVTNPTTGEKVTKNLVGKFI